MRQSAAETIVVKEKAIRLVRRADSARWQVHYKVDKLGKWMRVATGTDDVTRLAMIASYYNHLDPLRNAQCYAGFSDPKHQHELVVIDRLLNSQGLTSPKGPKVLSH